MDSRPCNDSSGAEAAAASESEPSAAAAAVGSWTSSRLVVECAAADSAGRTVRNEGYVKFARTGPPSYDRSAWETGGGAPGQPDCAADAAPPKEEDEEKEGEAAPYC